MVKRTRVQGAVLGVLLACACTTVLVSLGSVCQGGAGGASGTGTGGVGGSRSQPPREQRPPRSNSNTNKEDDDDKADDNDVENENDDKPHKKANNGGKGDDASSSFHWKRNEFTDRCHYVEDVCRTSHRFFYRAGLGGNNTATYHQPDLVWDMVHKDEWPVNEETVYKRRYRFSSSPQHPQHPSGLNEDTECTTSPITNHLVLYSAYNDMLGEFYDKSLVYLDALNEHFDWVQHSQLYLHLYRPYKSLLDSHHLFTAPYRTRPLLSMVELLDSPKCECLPRLILCGYEVATATVNANGGNARDPYPPGSGADPRRIRSPTPLDDDNHTRVAVVVRAGGAWDEVGKLKRATGRYRKTRNRLRSALVESNVHVLEDIVRFRDKQLDLLRVPPEARPSYRLVGLAQRTGRRRWQDLRLLLATVQSKLNSENRPIALVEMNLEEDSSSYQQLVRHASLDGLIGIHGAQLTEAVWMKNGSWVVELLPFVPSDVVMGHWTRTVHHPTPLGYLFHETGLNHAGYRLPVALTPYCAHDASDVNCWKDNMWDGRDFVVDPPLLAAMLDAFFPNSTPPPLSAPGSDVGTANADVGAGADRRGAAPSPPPPLLCPSVVERANGTFVLYNVHCSEREGDDVVVAPHHYYWPCTDKCGA